MGGGGEGGGVDEPWVNSIYMQICTYNCADHVGLCVYTLGTRLPLTQITQQLLERFLTTNTKDF